MGGFTSYNSGAFRLCSNFVHHSRSLDSLLVDGNRPPDGQIKQSKTGRAGAGFRPAVRLRLAGTD
jgi:hypothetical protein